MEKHMLRAEELIHEVVDSNCHIETDIRYASPYHSHDFYEIFIILDGECIHEVNGKEQHLKKGNAVLIRPRDAHAYKYPEDYDGAPCSFLNVNFVRQTVEEALTYIDSPEFITGIISTPYPPVISLDEAETAHIVKKAELINVYEPVDKEKARIAARGVLVEMLAYFYTNYSQDPKNKLPEWFNDLLLEIHRRRPLKPGTVQLAEISGKTTGHISRTFKKYLHITPTDYMNRLKLNYAKLLLITTDIPIIEISLEAGFDNLSNFYHLFKSVYKTSPLKMRNSRK